MVEQAIIVLVNDWSATYISKTQVSCIYCYSLAHLSKHGINFSSKAIFLTRSHWKFCEWTFYVMYISKCGISSAFQICNHIYDMLYGFSSNCPRTWLPLQATTRMALISHSNTIPPAKAVSLKAAIMFKNFNDSDFAIMALYRPLQTYYISISNIRG